MPVLPSYINQSTDLVCKSIDWPLYEGNTDIYWVKHAISLLIFKDLPQILLDPSLLSHIFH